MAPSNKSHYTLGSIRPGTTRDNLEGKVIRVVVDEGEDSNESLDVADDVEERIGHDEKDDGAEEQQRVGVREVHVPD